MGNRRCRAIGMPDGVVLSVCPSIIFAVLVLRLPLWRRCKWREERLLRRDRGLPLPGEGGGAAHPEPAILGRLRSDDGGVVHRCCLRSCHRCRLPEGKQQ